MGRKKHVLHDVIRKSQTVTLTVDGKSASETVVLEEPIDIYLEIDDAPYNRSVSHCGDNISMLRSSVIACNAAEVASKMESSHRIGKHVSSGFLNYIATNLDIQNMEEFSNLEAVSAGLHAQGQDLLGKKKVMGDDYKILATRYSGVFKDLDKELRNRIFFLLEPCFRFAENANREHQRNAHSSLLAMAMVGHEEHSELHTKICVGLMKQRAHGLIQIAKKYLLGQKHLAAHIEGVLIPGQSGQHLLPVLFFETSGEGKSAPLRVVMNQRTENMGVNEQEIRQEILSGNVRMEAMNPEDRQRIDAYLDKEIRSLGVSEHEQRVAQMIRKLHHT